MVVLANIDSLAMGDAGVYALLGYGVVFLGLILLMILVSVVGKAFAAKENAAAVVVPLEQPAPEEEKTLAPGSAGGVKLYDVEPKTAAMLMAIVADKLQKPINELRFISIKEVK